MPLGKSSPLCNWHHLVFWMPGLGSTHLCGKIWEQDWKRSSLQNYKRLLLKRQIPDGAANLLMKSFDQTWSWAPPSRGREREQERQRLHMRSRTWWSEGFIKVVVAALFVEKLWITSENWISHERVDSARHFGRLHRWWSFCRLHLSSGFYFCIFSQQGFLGFALYTNHDIGLVEFQRQIFGQEGCDSLSCPCWSQTCSLSQANSQASSPSQRKD